jgi:hypothetical protein
MKKINNTFCVILFIISMLGIGCAQPKSYTVKVNLENRLQLLFIRDADTKKSEITLKNRIRNVDNDGIRTVDVTIEAINVSVMSLTKKFTFDSAKDTAETIGVKADMKRDYKRSFLPLVGITYTARVNKQGNVVELVQIPEELEKVLNKQSTRKSLADQQIQLVFSKERLREYVSPMFFDAYSGDDITSGEEWVTYEQIRMPLTDMKPVKKTYKLAESTNSGDITNYKVTFKTEQVGTEKVPAELRQDTKRISGRRGQGMKIKSITGEGEVELTGATLEPVKTQESMVVYISTGAGRKNKKKQQNQKNMFFKMSKTIEIIKE